jgi:hypothetical protein
MVRFSAVFPLVILILSALAPNGQAQQGTDTDSVAAAGRQQKELKKEQKNSPEKVYTNADVGASQPQEGVQDGLKTSSQQGAGANPSTSGKSSDRSEPGGKPKTNTSALPQSSILDRPNKDTPDTIVVPAGTKITVDVSEENPPRNLPLRVHSAKVVNIVQVGSTVVMPALSKVTIQESVGVMQLTDVTVDGVRYNLQTDRVPILEGSISESTFTLTKEFTIKR